MRLAGVMMRVEPGVASPDRMAVAWATVSWTTCTGCVRLFR